MICQRILICCSAGCRRSAEAAEQLLSRINKHLSTVSTSAPILTAQPNLGVHSGDSTDASSIRVIHSSCRTQFQVFWRSFFFLSFCDSSIRSSKQIVVPRNYLRNHLVYGNHRPQECVKVRRRSESAPVLCQAYLLPTMPEFPKRNFNNQRLKARSHVTDSKLHIYFFYWAFELQIQY